MHTDRGASSPLSGIADNALCCVQYPKPDGEISFDLLTNLQRSGTYHDDDQPAHLRIKPELADVPKVCLCSIPGSPELMLQDISYQTYGAPETRFCPAKVSRVGMLVDDMLTIKPDLNGM